MRHDLPRPSFHIPRLLAPAAGRDLDPARAVASGRKHGRLAAIGAVCVTALWLGASLADAQTLGQRARERFDLDGDGKISETERETIRQALRDRQRGGDQLGDVERLTWQIDGIEREALVFPPKQSEAGGGPAPVVFGFHGHGGTARNAAGSFAFQKHWPEALVVYMQGIPTPGRLTDPEGKRNGWQHGAGAEGDRDLKFFDAVLATLQEKYEIDLDRVYSSGHSNGGGFTYLLWAERPDVFAAMAPSAAAAASILRSKPLPAMHIAGTNDELVKFVWQKRAIDAIRRINGCDEEGSEWAEDCTLYPSKGGTPFVAYIHDGTHKYPPEAPPLIVKFFKEHRRGE